VSQTGTLTVGGAPAAGNKIRVTMNRKYVEYTFVTADTTALMAAGLVALLQAADAAEFKEVTWTYPGTGSVISYASTNPGQPVTMTASATGGGATLTHAQVQAATGPNHATDATNWSAGTAPADGEDILVRGGSAILYGIDTAFAHDFASVEFAPGFTETLGLPRVSAGGYVEYRPRYAVFGNTVGFPVRVNCPSSRLFLSLKGGDVVDVLATGTRPTGSEGVPALNVLTRSLTTTVINVSGGDVGYCCETAQAGTAAIVRVIDPGTFTLGEGGTVTLYDQDGGTVDSYGDVTTADVTDGVNTQWGGTLGTIECDGGKVVLRHTGTVAAANFRGQPDSNQIATCDCTQDPRALTFTNASFTGGAYIEDPNKRVTFTNDATFDRASLARSNLGQRFTVNRV
jgi:hypothetical protein